MLGGDWERGREAMMRGEKEWGKKGGRERRGEGEGGMRGVEQGLGGWTLAWPTWKEKVGWEDSD